MHQNTLLRLVDKLLCLGCFLLFKQYFNDIIQPPGMAAVLVSVCNSGGEVLNKLSHSWLWNAKQTIHRLVNSFGFPKYSSRPDSTNI